MVSSRKPDTLIRYIGYSCAALVLTMPLALLAVPPNRSLGPLGFRTAKHDLGPLCLPLSLNIWEGTDGAGVGRMGEMPRANAGRPRLRASAPRAALTFSTKLS